MDIDNSWYYKSPAIGTIKHKKPKRKGTHSPQRRGTGTSVRTVSGGLPSLGKNSR